MKEELKIPRGLKLPSYDELKKRIAWRRKSKEYSAAIIKDDAGNVFVGTADEWCSWGKGLTPKQYEEVREVANEEYEIWKDICNHLKDQDYRVHSTPNLNIIDN